MARPSLRKKLASSAVETLHASGFNGCSVQDITEAAGVPKGSFYNHFESKETLAAAALQQYWTASQHDCLRLLHDTARSPRERLLAYFSQVMSDIALQQFRCGCLA